MVYAGVQHFLKPDFFVPYVPKFLPFKMEIVYVSGVFEVLFGLLLFFKKYAKIAATGIFVLLLLLSKNDFYDQRKIHPYIEDLLLNPYSMELVL